MNDFEMTVELIAEWCFKNTLLENFSKKNEKKQIWKVFCQISNANASFKSVSEGIVEEAFKSLVGLLEKFQTESRKEFLKSCLSNAFYK